MKFCKRRIQRNTPDNRCNALLAEFLQQGLIRRQANALERSDLAEQNMEKIDENIQNEEVTIPKELLFKIFILLPAESLYRIQFVCKTWFGVISCPVFLKCHAQKSETSLICKKLALSSLPFEGKPTPYFHFMDLEHGNNHFIKSNLQDFVEIFTSYDGLILAKMKNNNSLILANPATRKHTELPLGTNIGFIFDSYSLAFGKEENTFKIVHLFYQDVGSIGCEIMSVGTREWKAVYGLSSNLLGERDIKHMPVSYDGSLYWMPRIKRCDYFVSMNVGDETFIVKKLPTVSTVNDRLLETGGVLGFVTYATKDMMEIWILNKGEDLEENWIKRHSINLMYFYYASPIPICSRKNGKEMVFAYVDGDLSVYNFQKGEMKMVSSRYHDTEEWFEEGIENLYIPHQGMLMSW